MQATAQNRLNDFVVKLANVNGTGSATANSLLMKAIFRMGVPTMGKNYFPSNIQGLPTWFEIRVNKSGHLARSGEVDIMVAMNAETYSQDLAEVSPGGTLIYDSTWPRNKTLIRDDITILGIPLAKLCNEAFDKVRTRILMKNIAYFGALVALLDIDMDVVNELLQDTFAGKPNLIPANIKAIELGYDYTKEHFDCPLETRLESLGKTSDHILIDGNSAAALGCLYAGATLGAWYPITPSTSLMDSFNAFCDHYRKDPQTGRNRYCIVQAEDEIGAIGMTIGAGWAGARAFTCTSGPGISLMSEFLGFAYFTEVPIVVFDVQRGGPSTGLPTRTQQSDLLSCAYASHGDTRHVLLFPADPHECFELSVAAFDLAERLQTPVIVMTDLDIGMNDWMCPRLEWDDSYSPDRGKVLGAEELEEIAEFNRYMDVDGDGICYRSLPGVHPRGAYFTRGSGHNQAAEYTENADEYKEVLDRLNRKSETAAALLPKPVLQPAREQTPMGLMAFGSSNGAVLEALDKLADEAIAVDYLRLRAFPFAAEVKQFLDEHDVIFVVEQNRDAQLKTLLLAETSARKESRRWVLEYSGLPIDYRNIYQQIRDHVTRNVAA